MQFKNILLLTSLGVLFLAYYVYIKDPIPPGFSQEWKVRIYLSVWKLASMGSSVLVWLGFDEPAMGKWTSGVVAGLHTLLETPDADVTRREEYFNGVKVHIYEPPNKDRNRRAIVFYHGGGFVIGDPGFFHFQMHRTAKHLGAVMVFPDYRLAPEFPFPAAFDDCLTVYKYFTSNAQKYGVDQARIAVMGDSAGGNLAAAIALHLHTHNITPLPKLQVLQFPLLQAENLDTPSYRANKDGPFLKKGSMAFFYAAYFFGKEYHKYINHIFDGNHTTADIKRNSAKHPLNINYLPDDEFRKEYREARIQTSDGNKELWMKLKDKVRDPRFSPLYMNNFSGMPQTYVTTCQYDVLRDDGYFYVHLLKAAEVKVDHVNLRACFHGWPLIHRYVDNLNEEYKKMMEYIDKHL